MKTAMLILINLICINAYAEQKKDPLRMLNMMTQSSFELCQTAMQDTFAAYSAIEHGMQAEIEAQAKNNDSISYNIHARALEIHAAKPNPKDLEFSIYTTFFDCIEHKFKRSKKNYDAAIAARKKAGLPY